MKFRNLIFMSSYPLFSSRGNRTTEFISKMSKNCNQVQLIPYKQVMECSVFQSSFNYIYLLVYSIEKLLNYKTLL